MLEMAKEVSSKARHLLSTFEGSRVTPRVNSTAHARGVGKPTTGEKLAKQVCFCLLILASALSKCLNTGIEEWFW